MASSENLIDLCIYLADGIIHETTSDVVNQYLDKDFPSEKLEEYVSTVGKVSALPGIREFYRRKLAVFSDKILLDFKLAGFLLNSWLFSWLLTSRFKLIKNMSIGEREDLLTSWANLRLSIRRKLFRTFYSLAVIAFSSYFPEIQKQAMGYPGKESRDDPVKLERQEYQMKDVPSSDLIVDLDVVIIGSGAGAGVAAHTLAESGFLVLVIEKGKYFKREQFVMNEYDGLSKLYQGEGIISSTNTQVSILAGSTFGGGTTVNWSASLKTPLVVRKEWANLGMTWAEGKEFDLALDYVMTKMGVSTDHIKHSFTNQTILDGSNKLNYHVSEVGQNTGGHEHPCGMCYLGCKFGIKQGSAECWFKTPGIEFMTDVRVVKLLKNGRVIEGVICESGTKRFTISGAKKYIVSGGSLNSPVLLSHSGFKNKHIGKNLKLHPSMALHGLFGGSLHPESESILTTVCDEVADLDGQGHGARIESILHSPMLMLVFFPWRGSAALRRRLLQYNQLSAILLITRDKGSGLVSATKDRPDALNISYSVDGYDKNALLEALLVAADILYIQGAQEIIPPATGFPEFHLERQNRNLKDVEYQMWRERVKGLRFKDYDSLVGSAHQMGSCKIGTSEQNGVCDSSGKVFEADNLYLADGSVMPSASGVNPMISIMGISRVIALGIVQTLKRE